MKKEIELEMAIREAPENAMLKRKRRRKKNVIKARDSTNR